MKRRASLLAVCLSLGLLAGCTLTTEWQGDPVFLVNGNGNGDGEPDPVAGWKVAETTMPEVFEVLGPPDEMLRQGRELWLVYRYRYLKGRELRLVAYGGQFFRWYEGKDVDSLVVVAFNPDDTLAYVGRGKYAGDKGVMSILLDR